MFKKYRFLIFFCFLVMLTGVSLLSVDKSYEIIVNEQESSDMSEAADSHIKWSNVYGASNYTNGGNKCLAITVSGKVYSGYGSDSDDQRYTHGFSKSPSNVLGTETYYLRHIAGQRVKGIQFYTNITTSYSNNGSYLQNDGTIVMKITCTGDSKTYELAFNKVVGTWSK